MEIITVKNVNAYIKNDIAYARIRKYFLIK